MRLLHWTATVAAAAIASTALTASGHAHAENQAQAQAQETYIAPLQTAIAELPVAAEDRTGYSRSLFPHWIDADSDGCNTRNEVLIAEAVIAPSINSNCVLSDGEWYSYYDDAYWTLPSDLDIDHVVALAEAWDSGASAWTTALRRSYANDLGDDRSLVAVTDNVNQSKGDQDPAEWIPLFAPARCQYLQEWVVVKIRWRLAVDQAELSALTTLAGGCGNVPLTVERAF